MDILRVVRIMDGIWTHMDGISVPLMFSSGSSPFSPPASQVLLKFLKRSVPEVGRRLSASPVTKR